MMSDPVSIALIAAVVTIVTTAANLFVSVRTARKLEVIHKATNSLTDRLVESTRSNALQEGHSQGMKDANK